MLVAGCELGCTNSRPRVIGMTRRGQALGVLSHRCWILTEVTDREDAQGVVGAADAVGAPLSELSRLLMRHEPAMDVRVPVWVAGRVACAARRWGVAVSVAGAWLIADGAQQVRSWSPVVSLLSQSQGR